MYIIQLLNFQIMLQKTRLMPICMVVFALMTIFSCAKEELVTAPQATNEVVMRGPNCNGIDFSGPDADIAMTTYLNQCFGFNYPAVGCHNGDFISEVEVLCAQYGCIMYTESELDAVLAYFQSVVASNPSHCRPRESCPNGHYELNGVFVRKIACPFLANGDPARFWSYRFELYFSWSCCSGGVIGPGGGGGN